MTSPPSSRPKAQFTYRGRSFVIEGYEKNDHLLGAIEKKRCFYELPLLEYVLYLRHQFFGEDTLTLDIGANVGNHSIFFSTFLPTRVLSFEPNPRIAPILKANLEANASDCSIFNVALGSHKGQGEIRVPANAKNNIGMAQIESAREGEGEIRIETLDEVLSDLRTKRQGREKVALLKVDVEGMELSVLKGAVDTLKSDTPDLLLEASDHEALEMLVSFLNPLGYELMCQWGSTPMFHFSHQPGARMRSAVRIARIRSKASRLLRSSKRKLSNLFTTQPRLVESR